MNDNNVIVRVTLKRPLRRDRLRSLEIWDTFQGGWFGDTRKMTSLRVSVRDGDFFDEIASAPGTFVSADDKLLVVPLRA